MIDFILGGLSAAVVVIGWLLLLALYDWFDLRGARRIQRKAAKP